MLTMLEDWKGDIEINGEHVADISRFKPILGQIHIKLWPKGKNAKMTRNTQRESENQQKDVDRTEYRITVRQYMTHKSTPEFDFMAKWNNDNPMPLRTMTGWIERETPGMYLMHLRGTAIDNTIKCMRCGRVLTNPVSKKYGIGPECLSKIGFMGDPEDVTGASQQLSQVTWSGWVIKKAIENQEVIQ